MGISFLGNTPDFKTWAFNIDGKTFLARNSSTVSPLKLLFTGGRFFGTDSPDTLSKGLTFVKNTSFDIITGTSVKVGDEYNGIVEWTWAGQKYRNAWKLYEGDVIREPIPEENDPGIYSYDLYIVVPPYAAGYVPYDGPTGGAVGGGVVSQGTVEAQRNGGTAPSGGGTAPSGGGTAPSGGGSTASGGGSPFTTTTTATGGGTPAVVPGAEVAGTDWAKLALQVGAAYLLFS